MKTSLLAVLLSLACFTAKSQQAGKFDYYLLSLSWSPEYCYGHQGSPECARHLGLVVHGLWPQYNGANSGPEHCGNQPGPSNPESLLYIMPTAALVDHEWNTHGTCSGLSANDYFALMRRIFTGFHVPAPLLNPSRQSIVRVARSEARDCPGESWHERIRDYLVLPRPLSQRSRTVPQQRRQAEAVLRAA
jgi:ribonuclease I